MEKSSTPKEKKKPGLCRKKKGGGLIPSIIGKLGEGPPSTSQKKILNRGSGVRKGKAAVFQKRWCVKANQEKRTPDRKGRKDHLP